MTHGTPPELTGSPLDPIVRILLEAGQPLEGIEEKAHLWLALRSSIDSFDRPDYTGRRPPAGHRGWELRFAALSPAGVVHISNLLAKLGIEPGRPYASQDRILLPVYGRQYPWLQALLTLDPPPGFSPSPAPAPARARLPERPPGRSPRRKPHRIRARTPIPELDTPIVRQLVATDASFERSTWRGQPVWAGRCLQCNALLLVGLDGELVSAAQILWMDGDGATEVPLEGQGLVCLRCGVAAQNQDTRGEERLTQTLATLKERRKERWRVEIRG